MEIRRDYLIDSDILIDYLRGFENARTFLIHASQEVLVYISVVSVVEIYSGKETKEEAKRERIDRFLDNFEIIWLDPILAKYAGELRRDYQEPFADMIVAATALHYNLQLATRNTKHFEGIKALRVISPY